MKTELEIIAMRDEVQRKIDDLLFDGLRNAKAESDYSAARLSRYALIAQYNILIEVLK